MQVEEVELEADEEDGEEPANFGDEEEVGLPHRGGQGAKLLTTYLVAQIMHVVAEH